MEHKQKWEELSREEKTALLNHWVFYYSGIPMILEDLDEFKKLSLKRQDEIFDHIITSYLFEDTIQSNLLIMYLRENNIDELFNASLTPNNIKEENRDSYENARDFIFKEIQKSFFHPQKSEPMDIVIVIKDDLPRTI